jgi:hypothetical protein
MIAPSLTFYNTSTKKYAKMDAHILKANLKIFEEEPQMDNPVDGYFVK